MKFFQFGWANWPDTSALDGDLDVVAEGDWLESPSLIQAVRCSSAHAASAIKSKSVTIAVRLLQYYRRITSARKAPEIACADFLPWGDHG